MNSLRDKLKTMYKDDKYRRNRTNQDSFGQKSNDNGYAKNLNKKLLKRKLNLEPVIDRTELLISDRRIDLDEYQDDIEDVNNDIKYDENPETLKDQIALESQESSAILKPLNKVLAKTDDIIYKQMNFWRNQFESQRLIDFLSPMNDNSTKKEEAKPKIETELIIGTPKQNNKKRKNIKKFKDKADSIRKEFETVLYILRYRFD